MDESHQISYGCNWQRRLEVTHAGGHIAADDSHFISTSGHICRRGSCCRGPPSFANYNLLFAIGNKRDGGAHALAPVTRKAHTHTTGTHMDQRCTIEEPCFIIYWTIH